MSVDTQELYVRFIEQRAGREVSELRTLAGEPFVEIDHQSLVEMGDIAHRDDFEGIARHLRERGMIGIGDAVVEGIRVERRVAPDAIEGTRLETHAPIKGRAQPTPEP